MGNRKRFVIFLGAIAFLALCKFLFFRPAAVPAPKGGAGRGGPVAVTVYVVHPETLAEKIQATGTLLANEAVELRPEIAGKAVRIAFTEGAAVRKGDLLVKINDAEFAAELARLKAREKAAADREFRGKKLLDAGGESQEGYDAAASELLALRAEMSAVRAQIAKTEIRAPFDGVAGLRSVSEGGYVTPLTVIASLRQVEPMKLDFSIPERYAGRVAKGDRVRFFIDGGRDTLTAAIFALEPAVDPETRTLALRARFSNPGKKVLPGAFARVEVVLREISDALLIPTPSVIPGLKGQKVFVVKGGRALEQAIDLGLRMADRVQVTAGLAAGDTVVMGGTQFLKSGAPVLLP